LENARIDLDLFDTGTIEFLEGCDNASLFAGTGWTVDKEMWEITALCLQELADDPKALDGS
jgi:hypothetical protein